MCEVISCGDAHPGVSGGWLLLLLTGLAVLTAGKTERAVDGSVVELGEAWQAAGEVVRADGVRVGGQQVASLAERPRGRGTLVLHWQLLLYQVSQGLAGDVERVEAQIVILLFAGWAEAKGRLPVCGRRHWYCVCHGGRETSYWSALDGRGSFFD